MKKTILTLGLVLALLVGFDYLNAWTIPTEIAPGGNIATPVNTGSENQIKSAAFAANELLATTVTGSDKMMSGQYCDLNGENCWNPEFGSATGGSISLSVENGETYGDIVIANTLCIDRGHDGVWAAMDRSGTEDVICYDSPVVNGLRPRVKFVTQFSALNRDPDFRDWFHAFGGATLPSASTVYYNYYGWYMRSDLDRTIDTFDKICSFMMDNGKYAGLATFADYGSDNDNRFYWPTEQWNVVSYNHTGYIDAVDLTCEGDAVSSKGEFWQFDVRGINTCSNYRCNPYPVPPANR